MQAAGSLIHAAPSMTQSSRVADAPRRRSGWGGAAICESPAAREDTRDRTTGARPRVSSHAHLHIRSRTVIHHPS